MKEGMGEIGNLWELGAGIQTLMFYQQLIETHNRANRAGQDSLDASSIEYLLCISEVLATIFAAKTFLNPIPRFYLAYRYFLHQIDTKPDMTRFLEERQEWSLNHRNLTPRSYDERDRTLYES